MSAEVHLERQRRAASTATAAFAPRVPTVTLISHRQLRDKHADHRPVCLDLNLAGGSLYRGREGKSL